MLTPSSIFRIIMIVGQLLSVARRLTDKPRDSSVNPRSMDKLKFIIIFVVGLVGVSLILRPIMNLPLWVIGVIVTVFIAWRYSRKASGRSQRRDKWYAEKDVKFFCSSCGTHYTNSHTEYCGECGQTL